MVGSLVIALLPPRPDFGETLVRVAIMIGATLGIRFLIYRRFFPTPLQRREEDAKAAAIAAAVRRLRERDSRL